MCVDKRRMGWDGRRTNVNRDSGEKERERERERKREKEKEKESGRVEIRV